MAKNKITVLPQHGFDSLMTYLNLDDSNVELNNNLAMISIICSYECNNTYMVEKHGIGDVHHFKEDHQNVLNINFDDLENDKLVDGLTYKTINTEQADILVNFIFGNIGRDFIIHCHAGISRSGAIAQFIRDYFNNDFDVHNFDLKIKSMIRPNQRVYKELKQAYERKIGLVDYENWII